jgi:hypothetical protein
MRIVARLALALALAATAGCSKADPPHPAAAKEELPAMTVDEVERGLATKELQTVDCNMDETRHELGVIPGAIIVDSTDSYPASVLPADKTAKLVFYCQDPG